MKKFSDSWDQTPVLSVQKLALMNPQNENEKSWIYCNWQIYYMYFLAFSKQ
jgi:hypothetical protein